MLDPYAVLGHLYVMYVEARQQEREDRQQIESLLKAIDTLTEEQDDSSDDTESAGG